MTLGTNITSATVLSMESVFEYSLFIVEDGGPANALLPKLEGVRKAALAKLAEIAPDYIWQRESFQLESKSVQGLFHLHGATDCGDSVDDEWLTVYLLRELTRAFPNLWVRVSDGDGEFLLIEAAAVLPKWLSPENDSNRVWIHDGKLLIIPLSDPATRESSKRLSLPEALRFIRTSPDALVHSTFTEAEAFYRLEKYPAHIAESLHRSLVTIPRKLAYILHARPKAVSPATEAFYLREPVAMKPLLSPAAELVFPPADLVTVSVCFTKMLYAQLKSQRFDTPLAWRGLIKSAGTEAAKGAHDAQKRLARLQMGVKLTSGFEILARRAGASNSRVVREVALLLEDLDEDGESVLPSDGDIRTWNDVEREDDDSWMDINFEDFERELDGKRAARSGQHKQQADEGFGDAKTQADLQRIVAQFESFMNDKSAGIGGAELDEMDHDNDDEESSDGEGESEDEDREVSFDEEQFSRMMRDMMGLPPEAVDAQKAEGKEAADARTTPGAASPGKDHDDEKNDDGRGEDEEIRRLMQQMETELNEHGALSLDPTPSKIAALKGKEKISRGPASKEEEESGEQDVNIDYNLVKNMLKSFKGQAGVAGPAGNLLGLMGLQLPRDEGSDEEEADSKNGE